MDNMPLQTDEQWNIDRRVNEIQVRIVPSMNPDGRTQLDRPGPVVLDASLQKICERGP